MTIEEGSGCINMMLEQAKDPKKFTFLFKPALNYYMCCKASELSFKDLFKDLEKYKRETLEMLKVKCKDHEDRIAKLEVDHSEMRHNNDKDHVRFDQ